MRKAEARKVVLLSFSRHWSIASEASRDFQVASKLWETEDLS